MGEGNPKETERIAHGAAVAATREEAAEAPDAVAEGEGGTGDVADVPRGQLVDADEGDGDGDREGESAEKDEAFAREQEGEGLPQKEVEIEQDEQKARTEESAQEDEEGHVVKQVGREVEAPGEGAGDSEAGEHAEDDHDAVGSDVEIADMEQNRVHAGSARRCVSRAFRRAGGLPGEEAESF
jgi:hypothetical protein